MTSDYCGFNRNSVEIKETQETKTKGKIQDEKGDEMEEEMEDRRQKPRWSHDSALMLSKGWRAG